MHDRCWSATEDCAFIKAHIKAKGLEGRQGVADLNDTSSDLRASRLGGDWSRWNLDETARHQALSPTQPAVSVCLAGLQLTASLNQRFMAENANQRKQTCSETDLKLPFTKAARKFLRRRCVNSITQRRIGTCWSFRLINGWTFGFIFYCSLILTSYNLNLLLIS